jgi:hypothetical protein
VVRPGGIGVGEIGIAHFHGDDGQHTTASDRFEVKGVVGEPKSSHIKSVLMRHVPTEHVRCYSPGFCKRWKLGNAKHASSHRLRRDEHLAVTQTAKTTWSIGRTSIRHNSRPQWPSNHSCERQSKNSVHGSVYGGLISGLRRGGAGRAYAGLRLGFVIALVPVQEH